MNTKDKWSIVLVVCNHMAQKKPAFLEAGRLYFDFCIYTLTASSV